MDNILRNTVIAKVYGAFKRAYPESVIGKLAAWLKKRYDASVSKRLLVRFVGSPSTGVYSRYNKCLSAWNGFWFRVGERLRPGFENSIIYKLGRGISNSAFVEKSAILRGIKKLGVRGLILIAFGMYLPLDVFLREVVGIEFISAAWDEAFLVFSVIYIIWNMIRSKTRIAPRITPIDAPILVFLAVSLLLMCIVSPNGSIAFAGYRAVCQFMLWFFVITRIIRDEFGLKVLYFSICAMAVCIALHGIYQYIIAVPMPSKWVAEAEMTNMRTRIFSITGSPNILGALMVMTAPMLCALAYYCKKLWVKTLMWGATFLICLAVILTFSRGAWFGLAIAVVIFALRVDRKLLIYSVVALIGMFFFVPEISNRIAFLFTSEFVQANTSGGRGERWNFGYTLLRQNPIFGFGLGRFGGAIAMQNQVIDGMEYFYMDNYYLKTLVEMGYVGLVSYLFLLISNIIWAIRGIFKTRRAPLSILSTGMLAGMCGVLAHSFFENIFEVPYMNAYFWGLAAGIMFISYIRPHIAKQQ